MANPKGNESNLAKFKPKWQSGKTQAIRVPIAIVDYVLECARVMDVNGNKSLVRVIEELKEENERLQAVITGTSSSSQIKETSKQLQPENKNFISRTSKSEEFKDSFLENLTDAEGNKLIGCDRSTIGKIRRGKLSNSPLKKKIYDLGFRPCGKYWVKVN